MIKQRYWSGLREDFLKAQPFNHIIIDDFFEPEVAEAIASEFPSYNDPVWNAHWKNAIEDKKGLNHWDKFPPTIYRAFDCLMSRAWTTLLEGIVGNTGVQADYGLNGGGLHIHSKGGKLNVHLDYSIHPKLKLERHYNIIIYMTPNWNPEWGGGLELWSHNEVNNTPKELITTVENRFNRAVIFDTTQNSWHGLPERLDCPEGVCRQSLAAYYLTQPKINVDPRGKALFAPHKEQANDPEVLELIKRRADVAQAEKVYKK